MHLHIHPPQHVLPVGVLLCLLPIPFIQVLHIHYLAFAASSCHCHVFIILLQTAAGVHCLKSGLFALRHFGASASFEKPCHSKQDLLCKGMAHRFDRNI